MALHFDDAEYESRKKRLLDAMAAEKLGAMLLFAQESMYWLTGYDTFGFCFFQCLVVRADGEMRLMTRSADLRQARQTSTINDIVIWIDREGANPARELKDMLDDMDLLGARIGVEYQTHGLTAANGRRIDEQLSSFGDLIDASGLVAGLRAVKSEAEIACARRAGDLADIALDAALPLIGPDADEGSILAAMQGAIFEAGGDYPGNEFIIGSGRDALLCRYKSGRRRLSTNDQLTLEWAGTWRHYHAAMMRTVIVGAPTERHLLFHSAAREALEAVEAAMRPGKTFGDVYDAHARVLDAAELTRHRLNACGYSLGARFTPSWMDTPMFFAQNSQPVVPGMILFAHMIIMDSETEIAMTLGRTYLTTEGDPEPLSRHGLELIVR